MVVTDRLQIPISEQAPFALRATLPMVRCERRLDARAGLSGAPYLDHGGGRENVTDSPPNQIHGHTEGQYYQPMGLLRSALIVWDLESLDYIPTRSCHMLAVVDCVCVFIRSRSPDRPITNWYPHAGYGSGYTYTAQIARAHGTPP